MVEQLRDVWSAADLDEWERWFDKLAVDYTRTMMASLLWRPRPALIGMMCGQWIRGRIRAETFRRCFPGVDLCDDELAAIAGEPADSLLDHLTDEHGIGTDTGRFVLHAQGVSGLVKEHDLDHTENSADQLGHAHPSTW